MKTNAVVVTLCLALIFAGCEGMNRMQKGALGGAAAGAATGALVSDNIWGVLIGVGYMVLFGGLLIASGVDYDTVGDTADNCPQLANPAQTDTDLDGIGDLNADGCLEWVEQVDCTDTGDVCVVRSGTAACELHDLRIRCKKLRYAIEAFVSDDSWVSSMEVMSEAWDGGGHGQAIIDFFDGEDVRSEILVPTGVYGKADAESDPALHVYMTPYTARIK